ncbi:MAG: PIG-L deacetylase family protein [Ornithinimicrobium sp.]
MTTETGTLEVFDEDWQTALCVAAHPDDLEYGLAAGVARWTGQGKTITYLLATSGEAGIDSLPPVETGPLREQEERNGAAHVGVDVVDFLGMPDGSLMYGLELRKGIAAVIRRTKPEVVFALTHREQFAGGGLNQADHRHVGLATLDACGDAGNRWLFPELMDEGLDPWSGVKQLCFANSAQPTHTVDVSATFEQGVASLEAHREYLEALGPDYPSARELLQMILGSAERKDVGDYTLGMEVIRR